MRRVQLSAVLLGCVLLLSSLLAASGTVSMTQMTGSASFGSRTETALASTVATVTFVPIGSSASVTYSYPLILWGGRTDAGLDNVSTYTHTYQHDTSGTLLYPSASVSAPSSLTAVLVPHCCPRRSVFAYAGRVGFERLRC